MSSHVNLQPSAPAGIISIWKQFDIFPMETLTKAWVLKNKPHLGQRDVAEMKSHREKTGASGNCFDLAIWLIHEFEQAAIPAYAVGDFMGTPEAHVGVIAVDGEGRRFLCDLGDQWIQPIAVDLPSDQLHEGFFAGAKVKLATEGRRLNVEYHRPGGKVSRQSYDLSPVSKADLLDAGEASQKNLSPPLVEMRLVESGETIHWEFDKYKSFYSRMSGLEIEELCRTDEDWAQRIALRTGMNITYVIECLVLLRKP